MLSKQPIRIADYKKHTFLLNKQEQITILKTFNYEQLNHYETLHA